MTKKDMVIVFLPLKLSIGFLKRQMIVIQYLCPLKAFKPVSSKAHGLSPIWFLSSMHTGLYCTPLGLRHLYKNTPHKAFNHILQGKKE